MAFRSFVNLSLFTTFLLLAGFCRAGISDGQFQYQEQTGDRVSTFSWTIELSGQAEITSVSEDETFYNLCDKEGATLFWRLQKESGTIEARRLENFIHITGKMDGKPVDKKLKIDESPWFQPLSYCLRGLALNDDKKTVTFWMIRPDTVDVVRLKARKGEECLLKLGEDKTRAIKVNVNLAGLLSPLWNGRYWFRAGDGLFLRYQSRHGPPGTPMTIISLRQQ